MKKYRILPTTYSHFYSQYFTEFHKEGYILEKRIANLFIFKKSNKTLTGRYVMDEAGQKVFKNRYHTVYYTKDDSAKTTYTDKKRSENLRRTSVYILLSSLLLITSLFFLTKEFSLTSMLPFNFQLLLIGSTVNLINKIIDFIKIYPKRKQYQKITRFESNRYALQFVINFYLVFMFVIYLLSSIFPSSVDHFNLNLIWYLILIVGYIALSIAFVLVFADNLTLRILVMILTILLFIFYTSNIYTKIFIEPIIDLLIEI